jgi:predicted protein tyrosine phosphatase
MDYHMTKAKHLLANMNQLANVHNRYQGAYKKVLFVCSAGLLRSATAAHVFSAEPYNFNTRTAGVALEYALNPVNEALLEWADNIFLMDDEHYHAIHDIFGEEIFDIYGEKMVVLNVPDKYPYRDEQLMKILKEKVEAELGWHSVENIHE